VSPLRSTIVFAVALACALPFAAGGQPQPRGAAPGAASWTSLGRGVEHLAVASGSIQGHAFRFRPAEVEMRVVPAADLLATAHALAREIADNTSAISVALSRQMLWRMLGADHPMAAHQIDSKAIFSMGRSPDAYEGVKSFLEKRPPRFAMKPSSDMPDFFPWWKLRKFSD